MRYCEKHGSNHTVLVSQQNLIQTNSENITSALGTFLEVFRHSTRLVYKGCSLFRAGWLLGLLLNLDYGSVTFFRKVGCLLAEYVPLYPKLYSCSKSRVILMISMLELSASRLKTDLQQCAKLLRH
jgi:hypothetical protein